MDFLKLDKIKMAIANQDIAKNMELTSKIGSWKILKTSFSKKAEFEIARFSN